jgi:uracil-DNA glycosylase family 4
VPRHAPATETPRLEALVNEAPVSEVLAEVAQPEVVPAEMPSATISVVETPAVAAPVSESLSVVGNVVGSVVGSASSAESGYGDNEEPPLPTDDYMPSLDMSELEASSDSGVAPVIAPSINVDALDWPALQSAVSGCTACSLHQSRTQTVFGVGSHAAEWMVIGEAPGAEEDQQGEPFVGPSGELLNNMLRALGLKREQVFITNILKCRPADDRDPRPKEIAHCEAFLRRQVALVAPKLILAVGGVAAHGLLKVDTPVTKLRGQLHQYGETPVVVTYHPAYLLRKPSEKAKSWQDLQFAASILQTGEKANDKTSEMTGMDGNPETENA